MFKRLHHQKIEKVLLAMNADFLREQQCYFAGGTAISLLLDEYRESVDIDFLCSSQIGYRALRNTIRQNSLGDIFAHDIVLLREVRADRYGIRTFVEMDGIPIKLEMVSEGRISLSGGMNQSFPVPLLSREDMYAEKLLANADRYNDRSANSRDIIDLAMLIDHYGDIPTESWQKVRQAYGESATHAFDAAIDMIGDEGYLNGCLRLLKIQPSMADQIRSALKCTPITPQP